MKALIENDRVVGVSVGDGEFGIDVPVDLLALPIERLACVNGVIVDAATLSTFWIDARGTKYPVAGDGRQQLACSWNAELVNDVGTWRTQSASERIAPRIKAHCGGRIFAVASRNTQMNMTAAVAANLMSAPDVAVYRQSLGWVAAMRAKCAELIAAADAEFANDAKWPAVPAGVAELCSRY